PSRFFISGTRRLGCISLAFRISFDAKARCFPSLGRPGRAMLTCRTEQGGPPYLWGTWSSPPPRPQRTPEPITPSTGAISAGMSLIQSSRVAVRIGGTCAAEGRGWPTSPLRGTRGLSAVVSGCRSPRCTRHRRSTLTPDPASFPRPWTPSPGRLETRGDGTNGYPRSTSQAVQPLRPHALRRRRGAQARNAVGTARRRGRRHHPLVRSTAHPVGHVPRHVHPDQSRRVGADVPDCRGVRSRHARLGESGADQLSPVPALGDHLPHGYHHLGDVLARWRAPARRGGRPAGNVGPRCAGVGNHDRRLSCRRSRAEARSKCPTLSGSSAPATPSPSQPIWPRHSVAFCPSPAWLRRKA